MFKNNEVLKTEIPTKLDRLLACYTKLWVSI